MNRRIITRFSSTCLIIALVFTGCTAKIKGSVGGTVYRNGKPASGTIRIFNPNGLSQVAETLVMEGGKFMIKDLPPGEYLIGLTGRTGSIIGQYHYLKITGAGFKSDFIFDSMEEDPKAKDLISKTSAGKSE